MGQIFPAQTLRAVGISGSPVPYSTKSRLLLLRSLDRLSKSDAATPELIELALLSPDGLLGRHRDAGVEAALRSIEGANLVIVSAPAHRGSYGGLLRVFFDLLPDDALEGKVALPILQGGPGGARQSRKHPLQGLLAGLGALVVPEGVVGTDAQFENGSPDPALVARVDDATRAALTLAAARGASRNGTGGYLVDRGSRSGGLRHLLESSGGNIHDVPP